MIRNKWIAMVIAYAVWVIVLALGFWFWAVSRSALISILAQVAQGEILQVWRARFVDQAYAILIGLAWVALAVIAESYLRNGATRGDVLLRSARLLGVELLLIGGADLVLFVLQGPLTLGWLRWLVLVAELASGVILLRWYRARRRPARAPSTG